MPSEEIIRDLAQEKVKAGLKEVGSLRIVQGRGLETGDVAVIDIELRRKDNNEVVEGSQQSGKQIDTAQAQHTVELPGAIRTPLANASLSCQSIFLAMGFYDTTFLHESGILGASICCMHPLFLGVP